MLAVAFMSDDIPKLMYVNGVHYDTNNNVVPVSNLISPKPHPDNLAMALELRECKTPEEHFNCMKKYGFTMGSQTKDEAIDFQKT